MKCANEKTKYALTNPIRRLRTKVLLLLQYNDCFVFFCEIFFLCFSVFFSVTNHYCFMKIRCLSSFLGGCFCAFYLTVFANHRDANGGKCRGSKTQTNRDGAGDEAGAEGGPMPACRFPPRLREPARRTTALASASCRRRGTTTVMAAGSGKRVCVKRF